MTNQPQQYYTLPSVHLFLINLVKYRTDESFKQALQSIENSFRNSTFSINSKSIADTRLKSTITR
jgi:hypothetical protein